MGEALPHGMRSRQGMKHGRSRSAMCSVVCRRRRGPQRSEDRSAGVTPSDHIFRRSRPWQHPHATTPPAVVSGHATDQTNSAGGVSCARITAPAQVGARSVTKEIDLPPQAPRGASVAVTSGTK